MLPYLIKTGRVTSREQVLANTDLTQSTELLRNNPKIRVQICEDDFLLTPTDLPWFRSTFGNNLTDYPVGGHLEICIFQPSRKIWCGSFPRLVSDEMPIRSIV